MNLFVSWDGDHAGRLIGRARLADQPEEVAKLSQAIDRGNEIWRSWALSVGGKIISIGGDEGSAQVPVSAAADIQKLREQYATAVGTSVSVGVGMKLSEADKSLLAAKLQGGDRVVVHSPAVDQTVADMKEKSEREKLYDEYLDPESIPIKKSAPDYEQAFHQAAMNQKHPDKPPDGVMDQTRQKVLEVLQQVKANAPKLEEMAQTNPELYQSIQATIQAMIAMAKDKLAKSEEPLEKSVKRCKWRLGERRCMRFVSGDYCHDHVKHAPVEPEEVEPEELEKAHLVLPVNYQLDTGPESIRSNSGFVKVRTPDGKSHWRSVRAAKVMAPDGTATSSRRPNGGAGSQDQNEQQDQSPADGMQKQ